MTMTSARIDVQKLSDRIEERRENGGFSFSYILTIAIIAVVILSMFGKVFKFADWFSGIDRDKRDDR